MNNINNHNFVDTKLLDGKNALVVTPFLPVPADAGQRKRVSQFLSILDKQGVNTTLLHYAIEMPYHFSDHLGLYAECKQLVDTFITVYPSSSYGIAPMNGTYHHIDEWWDPDLEEYLKKLFKHQWFDIVIVNNVWLSKVFNFCHEYSIKIMDTHDVFSERISAYQEINFKPDFFICNLKDEISGWERANINIAITDVENETISKNINHSLSLHLPYFELNSTPYLKDYIYPDKVIFGFMGSAHPFNTYAIKQLIKKIKFCGLWSPVELIIAGGVCETLDSNELLYVKSIGYVQCVDDFYNAIDFFISPVDYGSGLKIKVVEAISKKFPVISTMHSAVGTYLDNSLIVENLDNLFYKLEDIACTRPKLLTFIEAVSDSYNIIKEKALLAELALVKTIQQHQVFFLLSYPELLLPVTDPRFISIIALVRELSLKFPIAIDLGVNYSHEPKWLVLLPPNIRIVSDALNGLSSFSRPKILRKHLENNLSKIFIFTSIPDYQVVGAAGHFFDTRFSSSKRPAHNVTSYLMNAAARRHSNDNSICIPFASDSFMWDPIFLKIRSLSNKQKTVWILKQKETEIFGLESFVQVLIAQLFFRTFKIEIKTVENELFNLSFFEKIYKSRPVLIIDITKDDASDFFHYWSIIFDVKYTKELDLILIKDLLFEQRVPTQLKLSTQWFEFVRRLDYFVKQAIK